MPFARSRIWSEFLSQNRIRRKPTLPLGAGRAAARRLFVGRQDNVIGIPGKTLRHKIVCAFWNWLPFGSK